MANCCCGCGVILLAILALIILVLWIWKKMTTKMCLSKGNVDGKIIIITGGTAGIGRVTAEEMVKRGAKNVVITGRDEKKGAQVAKEVQAINENCKVEFYAVDLCHMEQVRTFANYLIKNFDHIDILLNNAGHQPYTKVITSDKLESCMAGNYFAPFLLTHLLIPTLNKSPYRPRIINVSSSAHAQYPLDFDNLNCEKRFNGMEVYCRSKLAQVYYTRKLCRELAKQKSRITVNCLHPGFVATDLFRVVPKIFSLLLTIFKPLLKNCYEGAQTSIYCCVEPDLDYISGVYFSMCAPVMKPKYVNEELEDKLWNITRKLLSIDD